MSDQSAKQAPASPASGAKSALKQSAKKFSNKNAGGSKEGCAVVPQKKDKPCTIEVRYWSVAGNEYHQYIVFTGSDGSQTVFRSGPTGARNVGEFMGIGNRSGQNLAGYGPLQSSEDFKRTDPKTPTKQAAQFDDPEKCKEVLQKLIDFVHKWNAKNIDYHFGGINSNSFVFSALQSIGVKTPTPPPGFDTPGAGVPVP